MIAALYVQADGVYAGLPGVDCWPESRDARTYDGPHPVVAHPPCQRFGRFWRGSPLNPIHSKGDDRGCFAAALAAVRRWGGVLEHPEHSAAWVIYGLPAPPDEGWQSDVFGGWCCRVEQGFYGHQALKPTWLYAVGTDLPSLRWGRGEQRLHPVAVARYGVEKAKRIGILGMIGGGGNDRQRAATPLPFRDVLLSIAASAQQVAA